MSLIFLILTQTSLINQFQYVLCDLPTSDRSSVNWSRNDITRKVLCRSWTRSCTHSHVYHSVLLSKSSFFLWTELVRPDLYYHPEEQIVLKLPYSDLESPLPSSLFVWLCLPSRLPYLQCWLWLLPSLKSFFLTLPFLSLYTQPFVGVNPVSYSFYSFAFSLVGQTSHSESHTGLLVPSSHDSSSYSGDPVLLRPTRSSTPGNPLLKVTVRPWPLP